MSWAIRLNDCATLSSDFGVAVSDKFLSLPRDEQERVLRHGFALRLRAAALGVSYQPHAWWRQAAQSATHFEAALEALERQKALVEARARARQLHIARRRAQFDAVRSELVLQMLDAGVEYVCAAEGCGVCDSLTIDHVHPLSRGGTDDLSNLQFMCRAHNSSKGDRS